MSLMEFISSDYNLIFSIALILMLMISILEGISTLLGLGLSELIETILPDFEMEISNPDAPQSVLSKLLGWINFGKVPILIIFVCFLSAFGIVGYLLQYLSLTLTSNLLPLFFTLPAALVVSLPFVRIFTNTMQKIMPRDESSALSENSFIGQMATITLGEASKDSPAEGKVTDKHGQTHYFMIQPESETEMFKQGEQVLLSKPSANGFFAIYTDNVTLNNTHN